MTDVSPSWVTRTRAVNKRKSCICNCEEMNVRPNSLAYDACLTPSNRQNAAIEPTKVDADAVSAPTVKHEHPNDDVKENIYEQLVQICTEMSVKRYASVECSESDAIKHDAEVEKHDTIQDMNVIPKVIVKAENDGIDTADLAQRIQQELRRFEISQTVFARQILNRSQGTLSDLLRRPQPWATLGSGRHTYQRMADWLQLPDEQKLLLKVNETTGQGRESPKLVRKHKTVFTHLQKNTLHAVFKESQRPSKVMMLLIAKQLELDFTAVHNYFMNARRRQAKLECLSDASLSDTSTEKVTPIQRLKRPKEPKKSKPNVPHVTGDCNQDVHT